MMTNVAQGGSVTVGVDDFERSLICLWLSADRHAALRHFPCALRRACAASISSG
jgi:hypothetical protein